MGCLITSLETFRKSPLTLKAHVVLSNNIDQIILGKLIRSEVVKDIVEIEAQNEPFFSEDSPYNAMEAQLARLYYKNGN